MADLKLSRLALLEMTPEKEIKAQGLSFMSVCIPLPEVVFMVSGVEG